MLIKLKKQGHRVGLIVLTRGEMGTGGTAELRSQEIDHAASIMGAAVLAKLDWGDTRLVDTPEHRDRLAALFRQHKPKMVLAPYFTGGHGRRASHPDHLAAGQIAVNAVNYAALSKLDIEGDPYRVPALYHYFLPPEVMPTFVVDITDQFDSWIKSLNAHATQFQNPAKPRDYIWSLETMARYYGALIGVKYGQAFVIGAPIGIFDPMVLTRG